jgi:ribosomal protein uL22
MAKYNYSRKLLEDNQARSVARDAPVSTKVSIEVVKFLKGKTTKVAKAYLEKVLQKTLAIPFTRFTDGVGHRPGNGITSGRYPQKLSVELIKLMTNVEANASIKGLGEELKIIHFVAHRASTPMHYGRHPRREMKRTHIEIIVEEVETKKKVAKKKAKSKVEVKKVEKKTEVKPEVKKSIPKVEVKKEETNLVEKIIEKKPEVKVEKKVEESKVVEKKEEPKKEEPKKEKIEPLVLPKKSDLKLETQEENKK